MLDISFILQNSADKIGFRREKFIEKNIPTNIDRIVVMPFFGNINSITILSSILLKRFREELYGSQYFILASWGGFQHLFPYVDEYWGIKDQQVYKTLFDKAINFNNTSETYPVYVRNFNNYFANVIKFEDEFKCYYDNGLKQLFLDKFKHIKRVLPNISSNAILDNNFNRELVNKHGHKVFIFPTCKVNEFQTNKIDNINVSKEFWVALVEKLLSQGIVPVLYNGPYTYDLSPEFTDKCIYLDNLDINSTLAAIRTTGCLLDVFNGTSRLALLARCPFIRCDERTRFRYTKDYEIDDLIGKEILKDYLYAFSSVVRGDKYAWDSLFGLIIKKILNVIKHIDLSKLPLPIELEEIIPYDGVRKLKYTSLGVEFLKKVGENFKLYPTV